MANMRLFTVINQRRGLALATIAGVIFLIPVWLSVRSLPRRYVYPSSMEYNPLVHSDSRQLPFRYWNHRSLYPERYSDHSCMDLPAISDLQFVASSWQLLKVDNGSVYVFGAYYDNRFEAPLIRLLVYIDQLPLPTMFCQLWFPDDNEPQTELAEPLYAWKSDWGGPTHGVNEPYVLTCRCRRHPPDKEISPVAVALVTSPCGVATNLFDIQNAPFDENHKKQWPPRQNVSFGVCIKWLNYKNDVSLKLIEWMQLLKHFGAEKVYTYIVKLHPNTRKALKYYEDEGLAVLTKLSHAPQVSRLHLDGGVRNFKDLRRELLPLNDCLYRNIGKHDWIAVFDMDEIIAPPSGKTWADIVANETTIELTGVSALIFPNYFVLSGAQKDLAAPAKTRLLAHTWRARNHSPAGEFCKSFFNVSAVTAMHNHSPMSCQVDCIFKDLNDGPGKLLHFKDRCPYDQDNCTELHDVVKDDILSRLRGPVLKEIKEILVKLELEPPNGTMGHQ